MRFDVLIPKLIELRYATGALVAAATSDDAIARTTLEFPRAVAEEIWRRKIDELSTNALRLIDDMLPARRGKASWADGIAADLLDLLNVAAESLKSISTTSNWYQKRLRAEQAHAVIGAALKVETFTCHYYREIERDAERQNLAQIAAWEASDANIPDAE